jgi:hypothetical protein
MAGFVRRLSDRPWPGDDAARALRLWAAYPAFRAALDRAPRTFCHHDAFRRNLVARRAAAGREETVAIDWESAGWGALGGDLAALLLTSAWFFALEAAEVRALDRAAFAAYAAGLRAAGWRGDPRLARLGYTATAALLGGLADVGLVEPDAASRRRVAAEVGRPYDAAVAHLVALRRFALDRADEARALLAALP